MSRPERGEGVRHIWGKDAPSLSHALSWECGLVCVRRVKEANEVGAE